jgi:hypothetical protein
MFREYEPVNQVKPVEAVADAMMIATCVLTKDWLDDIRMDVIDDETSVVELLKRQVIEATNGRCFVGSAIALAYLKQEQESLFDKMCMLIAYSDSENKFRDDGWSFHAYFLVQDKDGVWFAGSPANYEGQEEGNDCLTNFFYDRSLKLVLDRIQSFEGGCWPDEKNVVSFLKDKPKMTGTYDKGTIELQIIYSSEGVVWDRQEDTKLPY